MNEDCEGEEHGAGDCEQRYFQFARGVGYDSFNDNRCAHDDEPVQNVIGHGILADDLQPCFFKQADFGDMVQDDDARKRCGEP